MKVDDVMNDHDIDGIFLLFSHLFMTPALTKGHWF